MVELAKAFVQPDRRNDVGHHPVIGIGPAFRNHALGGKVHDDFRPKLGGKPVEAVEIMIEVEALEAELARALVALGIDAEGKRHLFRTAETDDVGAKAEQVVDERGARIGVRADDENGCGHGFCPIVSRWVKRY
jgi:hypothetical protein